VETELPRFDPYKDCMALRVEHLVTYSGGGDEPDNGALELMGGSVAGCHGHGDDGRPVRRLAVTSRIGNHLDEFASEPHPAVRAPPTLVQKVIGLADEGATPLVLPGELWFGHGPS
jgi:hypothetical protein